LASRYTPVQWELDGISPDGMLLALRFPAALCAGSYVSVVENEMDVGVIAFVPDPPSPSCERDLAQAGTVGLVRPLANRALIHLLSRSG